jgi:hypothetical protein
MNSLETARVRVEHASDLTSVLSACHAAFMTLLDVIQDQQDRGGPLFAAFVMAGVPAASGRFAVTAAPSLRTPLTSEAPTRATAPAGSAEEIAVGVARLSLLIAYRLYEAALAAQGAEDRRACRDAARHALDLHARFSGTPPP